MFYGLNGCSTKRGLLTTFQYQNPLEAFNTWLAKISSHAVPPSLHASHTHVPPLRNKRESIKLQHCLESSLLNFSSHSNVLKGTRYLSFIMTYNEQNTFRRGSGPGGDRSIVIVIAVLFLDYSLRGPPSGPLANSRQLALCQRFGC